jgi:hypothetical protein
MTISAERSDKASLAPIVEYSKESEIIVIPADERAFMNAVSKLA